MAPLNRRFVLAASLGLALPTTAQPVVSVKSGKAEPDRGTEASYEILEVGPGKRFSTLTAAGCFMNGMARWNNGYLGPSKISKMGFRIIISPGPPGYYRNDSGSHSRKWPKLQGWPPYEGQLLGPVVIEGEPGKPPPVLDTDGYADGVLYNQTGLFATGSCDATFRRLIFRGFRRQDNNGNYAAIRLGQVSANIPMNSHVLIEDCEFSLCDNGVMGGAVGQSVTLRRCYFHDNGNETGLVHNFYFTAGDQLTVEDTLSTRCRIGHLMKSRAATTKITNSRFLGGGGTESACLDVPDAGVLQIDRLVCEKSAGSDATWTIHYSGENQDKANIPFHKPSAVHINSLLLVGPKVLTRHPGWGSVIGFSNQSGSGPSTSGAGSYFVQPEAQNVASYGIDTDFVGLPCKMLQSPPAIDRKSPVRT